MSTIHKFLDHSSVPTWRYERSVRVLLETVLLIACAVPVVTGWRSFVAQLVVGALRLHQAETGRKRASILSRAKEAGLATEPDVSKEKRERLNALDTRDAMIAWVWPVLVPIVQASETRDLGAIVAIGVWATYLRVWFDKVAMPMWRKSRVEWRMRKYVASIVGTCAPSEIVEENKP